jgi:hypothetical protein
VFPREQVLFALFDDFAARSAATSRRVLCFPGLPDDGRSSLPRYMENQRPALCSVGRWVIRPPARVGRANIRLKQLVRLHGTGIGSLILAVVARPAPRSPMSEGMREAFRDDIRVLKAVLDRNPAHWG